MILAIYDTSLAPEKWPEVLTRIAHELKANGAFIFELNQLGGDRTISAPYFSQTYTAEAVNAYLTAHNEQEIADQDTFARYSKLTDGIDLIGDDILADSEEELVSRANVRQLLEFGIRYRAGALLNKDHTSIDRFALQFSAEHGPITDHERQVMRVLLPHVAKALNINRPTIQLAAKYKNVINSLDLLRVGICIVRPYGDIIYKNREFDRQLDAFNAFRIDARGRLAFTARQCESELAAYMKDLFVNGRYGARPWKEAIVSAEDDEEPCLCLEVSPLTGCSEITGAERGVHLIYSLDATLPFNLDTPSIARRFALTAAEESVLAWLADGASNAEIADRVDRSIETVRSHVKSIFAKTGAANRAKLIRLATNMSFGMLHPSMIVDQLGYLAIGSDGGGIPRSGDETIN